MRLENSNSNKPTETINPDSDKDTQPTSDNITYAITTKQINAVSGNRDPQKGIESAKVVTTHNKYIAFTNEDDDDDNDDDHDNDSGIENKWIQVDHKTVKLNKRQRAKRRASGQQQRNDNHHDDDEAIGGAAAANRIPENEWTGINTRGHCKCNRNSNQQPRRRQVRFDTQDNDICTEHGSNNINEHKHVLRPPWRQFGAVQHHTIAHSSHLLIAPIESSSRYGSPPHGWEPHRGEGLGWSPSHDNPWWRKSIV